MAQQDRIRPTPGFRPRASEGSIRPRAGFKPTTLHTRALPSGSVEVEWCPICLGRKISEKMVSGKPMWHCDDCKHLW